MKHCIQRFLAAALALVLGLLLVGCTSLDLAKTPSEPVALSGTWQVDMGSSDDVDSAMEPDARLSDSRKRLSTRSEIDRIRRGSGLAFVADAFQVLEAKRMVIEAGDDSMGVQHQPGVYRDVSWGQRERGIWRVQAGWDENTLVVVSQTRGIKVVERYQLENQNRLMVSLDIRADGNERSIQRAFRRVR